jgi:hypothetical protein
VAQIGYWRQVFSTSAPRVIAEVILKEERLKEVHKIAINEGPDWLGSQMRNGEKQYIGRVLVYHSDLMEEAYEMYKANPIFEMIDPPVFQMYPIDWSSERFQIWYREMDRSDDKPGQRMWNFYLASEMEGIVGKHIVGTEWYKKNAGEIRKALNKTATIKTVMEDPMD